MKILKRLSGGLSSLFVISMLLLGSAVIRVASGANIALASEADVAKPEMQEDAQVMPEATSMDAPDSRDASSALLQALLEREKKAEEKDRRIEERLQILQAAEKQYETRLKQLTEAEERLKATIALASTAAEDDLARLTTVYENMKAKDAAKLFEAMSPDFAAGFLSRMKPESAAGIMAGLSPDAAYSVSVILAGRNTQVPSE